MSRAADLPALLAAAFGDAVPDRVAALLPPDADPAAFDAGVVLSSTGRHRAYIADTRDPAGWERGVRGAWPGCGRLLAAAPPGVRRMVDTDGTWAEVYLDDLHAVRPDLGLMCLAWSPAARTLARIRPVLELPPGFSALAPLATVGKLAARVGGGRPHVLWVSEVRWSGARDAARAAAEAAVGLPAAFLHLEETLAGVYIDALDIHADGAVDLTVGLLPAR